MPTRRDFVKFSLAGAAAALLPTPSLLAATGPNPAPAPQIFFPETGHNIWYKFRRHYERNGGLELFGLPLTEALSDNGLQVQYFERARFEYRPDLPDGVTLSLLGTDLTLGRSEPEFQWLSAHPGGGRRFFPQSGHSLGGAFRELWERKNGLIAFGYPISEELAEAGSDGVSRTVQYFERARFELHPEFAFTSNAIQLGHLGRQALERRADLAYATAPVAPITLLGSATTGFRGSSYERRINIQRATALFDGVVVSPGQEFSFIDGHDFSEASGFVEGYGIIGGKLDRVIGGGLCQVSTTLFRAVANAGLQITRRVPHTYVVYFYENIVGFDATVFTPGVDFRWRNDLTTPVTINVDLSLASGSVTFELIGTSDGRQVSYTGPDIRNKVAPGRPMWQYDPKLAAGQTLQLVHGRPGMDVRLARMITMPDGRTLGQNVYQTRYKPWDDFWTYGPDVTPPTDAIIIKP
jgi:VanW like protein/TAT (twin-arginine translocation) pathway signal sequence